MSSQGGNTTKPRTILRIKRRRNEEPLPYLRLEGLDGNEKRQRSSVDHQLSDLMNTSIGLNGHTPNTPSAVKERKTRSSAVWKRMKPNSDDQPHSYRIVDALLEDDGPQTKRRKLTVLETSSQTELISTSPVKERRKIALKVLDPVSRLVDDSLQQVHTGTKEISDHYRFISTDPRLAHDFKGWIAWCHSSGGNLLHACAMWNDLEVAGEILKLDVSMSEAADGDGRTPYELAQLAGHDSVCQVLEAFGGDASNYVYDIFYLDDMFLRSGENDDIIENDDDPIASVELASGVGYWTPLGELVLEAPEKHQASLDHFFDGDGEIDSNCEEYGGNDYPDEDASDDDSWAEAFTPDQGYRNDFSMEENGMFESINVHSDILDGAPNWE